MDGAAERGEKAPLRVVLDAFGNHMQSQLVPERDDGRSQRAIAAAIGDVGHEGAIDLQLVERREGRRYAQVAVVWVEMVREGRARGSDTGSLGPSDSTDSGSDLVGTRSVSADELLSDSDAAGTGDRAGVDAEDGAGEDIGFDRAVGPSEAGLGTGLDEAELARREHPDDEDETGR